VVMLPLSSRLTPVGYRCLSRREWRNGTKENRAEAGAQPGKMCFMEGVSVSLNLGWALGLGGAGVALAETWTLLGCQHRTEGDTVCFRQSSGPDRPPRVSAR